MFLYRFLPAEIRAFFLASGFEDIQTIAKTYGLSQDAIDALDTIQQEVLFGYEPVDKVRNLIMDRLKFEEKLATRVTLDVIEKRFLPIDSFLGSMAYRTFSSLGGNATIINIKRIDASGGTIVDVRRSITDYLADQAARPAPVVPAPVVAVPVPVPDVPAVVPPVAEPVAVPAQKTPPVKEESVELPVAKPPAQIVADPPKEIPVTKSPTRIVSAPSVPLITPEKPPVSVSIHADELPVKKEVNKDVVDQKVAQQIIPPLQKPEVVKTVEAFDAKLDQMDPERKGESEKESGIVNAPLDPSHELAPPPPVLVQPKAIQKKGRIASLFSSSPKGQQTPATAVPTVFAKPVQATESIIRAPAKEIVATMAPVKKKFSLPEVEEEAEVAKMMNHLKQGGAQAPSGIENEKIDEVKRKLSLSFAPVELDKRFRVLVGARLSGVRTDSAFALALARSVAQGGLGLDAHTVERVLDVVEGYLEDTHEVATKKLSEEKVAYVKARTKEYKTDSPVSVPVPVTASAPVVREGQKARTILSQTTVTAARTSSGKQPVVDVQYKRRLVGPVEELKRMNLEDFRRLPGSASEVLENIREDIGAMAQRDPALLIQGVEAWRSSPLVGLYRNVLSAALQQGGAIETVLADKSLNPGGMTLEELQEIRTFNASLRY